MKDKNLSTLSWLIKQIKTIKLAVPRGMTTTSKEQTPACDGERNKISNKWMEIYFMDMWAFIVIYVAKSFFVR